ncbi:hypothetical protein STAS_12055 [Striga asiatica]|uniref:KIB1-4 beta-propeller domain-containing protein n=1 Tax=Striga asiatica TaxID=4170 RepID=A0A5A7PSM6_STRAF|nr:hypothetical protein STAS_12055 [Striga asiatica]
MASSFSLTRPIDRKWFAGFHNHPSVGKLTPGSCSSAQFCMYRLNSSFYPKGMRTLAEPMLSRPLPTQNPSSSSSPWLMLPPAFDVDATGAATRSYKFYSLAENKIVTLSTAKSSEERELTNPLMHFRGSSHGWVALYDRRSEDVFLYNPITRRHINLPPFRHFPDYPPNENGVYKVILSCSPDHDAPNCRAIMIYNNVQALPFCCPGLSNEWTRIGDHHWFDEEKGEAFCTGYIDCVFSNRHEALFSLTNNIGKNGVLESWDLGDIESPRAVKIAEVSWKGGRLGLPRRTKKDEKKKLWMTNEPMEHLVVAGEDLLVVTQHVVQSFDFDGVYVHSSGNEPYGFAYERGLPDVTVDFDVHIYDPEDGGLKYVEGSCLGGWAIFVGFYSDAVALRAAEFPELKPNSIYFTDAMLDALIDDCPTGGHDIGIFDYENKTVSPCYFPCDAKNLRKTFPAPMWFFSSRE